MINITNFDNTICSFEYIKKHLPFMNPKYGGWSYAKISLWVVRDNERNDHISEYFLGLYNNEFVCGDAEFFMDKPNAYAFEHLRNFLKIENDADFMEHFDTSSPIVVYLYNDKNEKIYKFVVEDTICVNTLSGDTFVLVANETKDSRM